jgi:hypothetical protein
LLRGNNIFKEVLVFKVLFFLNFSFNLMDFVKPS